MNGTDRMSEDATVTGKGIKARKALIPWPLYSFQRASGAQTPCHVGETTQHVVSHGNDDCTVSSFKGLHFSSIRKIQKQVQ